MTAEPYDYESPKHRRQASTQSTCSSIVNHEKGQVGLFSVFTMRDAPHLSWAGRQTGGAETLSARAPK